MNTIPASFGIEGQPATGPAGQRAHPAAIEHSARLVEKLYKVGDRAWTLVGNGLSNQSFVEGPEGLIVIDTGECVEEMEAALEAVRRETSAPIVACIYTHFHYVSGTTALTPDAADGELPIYGHAGIEANLQRFGGEVGPRGARGLVHQFGVMLPNDGPDGLVNVGLGRFFRNPAHAPFTPGHVPATHTFDEPTRAQIAGLDVHFFPAPSDATDSVTVWFPGLKLAVNNLLWPALFNVFAIRGEEYRDPRILLQGLDQLADLGVDYLLGTHGPPIEGRDAIAESITTYRDAIQFLWDQTVRGANLGLTQDELVAFVQLPEVFNAHFLTQQFYGLAEHHVRQIYTGLFGWFDEDEARLLPTPAPLRAQRLIAGFGGADNVRAAIDQALADADFRWAIELASWLVRCELNSAGRADAGAPEDRQRLAQALRGVGQSTTSANIRNWCITRALELEGAIDLSRFRVHRIRAAEVLAGQPERFVTVLKVQLIPDRTGDLDEEVSFDFGTGVAAGLRIRRQVAVPTTGEGAGVRCRISHEHWAELLGGKTSLDALLSQDLLETNEADRLKRFFSCFDLGTRT